MALQQLRSCLADRTRLRAVYCEPGDRHAFVAVARAPDGRDDAGVGGGLELRRYSLQGDLVRPAGVETVTADHLAELVREALLGAGGAYLALIVRGRSLEFRFDERGVRRGPLAPDREAELLALGSGQARRAEATGAAPTLSGGGHSEVAWDAPPDASARLLEAAAAGPLLRAIGLAGPRGQVRRDQQRKYNQISHLASVLYAALAELPRDRELLIVDCGCGKSQSLLVLNYLAADVLGLRARFVGLDIDQAAIERARRMQSELGYTNMQFVCGSIRSWQAPSRVDVVLSLHACDTATDEALALGVASNAQVIIAVPCCQAEVAAQVTHPLLEQALAHGALRRRLGDWLTDALRLLTLESWGYAVRVLEYVSPLDTPKNLMLLATKGAHGPARRQQAARAAAELAATFGASPSLPRLVEAMQARARGR
jgi:SAM-dependent methyltransferase